MAPMSSTSSARPEAVGKSWSLPITSCPILVISDVDMADSDGLEVAREVVERSTDIKVILVSGHDDRSYARLAQQEGALAFIPKAKVSLEAVRQALIRTG